MANRRNLKEFVFGESAPEPKALEQTLALKSISFSNAQPRRYFDPEKLEQLTQSIKTHGVLEPLLVRRLEGRYELVAGERRYRAAKAAGLAQVPVIIRDLDENEAIQIALIENLQREDLNPVEETEGILRLLAIALDCKASEVPPILYRMQHQAKGKSTHNVVGNPEQDKIQAVFNQLGLLSWESFVNHRLPLLNLSDDVLQVLREGKLVYTKAQAIARIKDKKVRGSLLTEAIRNNLSLSEIRARIRATYQPNPSQSMPHRFEQAYRAIKKSKAWEHPKKKKQLEKLLGELEAIVAGG